MPEPLMDFLRDVYKLPYMVFIWPVCALILVALVIVTTPMLIWQLARGTEQGPADRVADWTLSWWNRLAAPWERR